MIKKLCQSIGLASLILLENYGRFLGGAQDARMHSPVALTGTCLVLVADIVLLSLVLFVLLSWLQQWERYSWARTFLAISLMPYLFFRTQSLLSSRWCEYLLWFATTWIILAISVRMIFPRGFEHVVTLGSRASPFFVLFAISSGSQLIWVASWKPDPN